MRPILDRLESLAVYHNGLYVPGTSIEGVLARHSFNLMVHNEHVVHKVSLVGSATAVLFQGRYILLCTNHQLLGVDPERVSMLKDDGSILVTSGGYRTFNMRDDTDAHDIAAFDFTEPVSAHPELKRRFYPLVEVPPDAPNIDIMAILLTGYPSAGQVYELEEKNHLGLSRLNVVCLPDSQPTDPATILLKAYRPLEIDPDGLSGGSAFVLQLSGKQIRSYFAGIVVRGSKSHFRVLKPGWVMEFLRRLYPASLPS